MTTQTVSLGTEPQRMIDYRLDTVDRLLLDCGVARAERMDVVQSIEDQIHELVDRRSEGSPTRDDVVAVLRELDPPEAYVTDWTQPLGSQPLFQTIARDSMRERDAGQPVQTGVSPLAISAFVCALVSVVLFMLFPFSTLLSLGGGILGIVGLARPKRRGTWMLIFATVVFGLQVMLAMWLLVVG